MDVGERTRGEKKAHLGIIHRKSRESGSLWPMLSKPEKISLAPDEVLVGQSPPAYIHTDRDGTSSMTSPGFKVQGGKGRKHTIQHRLTNRHHTDPKPHQTRHAPPPPLHSLPSLSPPPHNPQIPPIPDALDEIQRRLRGREPIARLPRFPAVDVVHAPVERVGAEEGRVQGAGRHAVRAQEHVGCVPEDEGEGE